jgi:ankyrin repeat protein
VSADAFVRAATSGRRARAEMLRAGAGDDPWAALVLGEGWDGDPEAPGGPRGWPPLHYVTHSVYARPALARELLERGADPNGTYRNEYGPMSALYGAAGVIHHPELTRLLLESGADPNDNESLYHSTEAPDPACTRLLLEHGAAPAHTNALAHALDDERLPHVRLLLDAGADPREGAILAHAVRRGRGPETLQVLAEAGAELDRPGGETWRGDVPLRTPYQHAVLRARDDCAALLTGLGANTAVAPEDVNLSAVARGTRPDGPLPADVDAQEVIILAALHGRLAVVLEVFGPAFRGVVGGSPEASLLGHACWFGVPEVVRELLARGVQRDPRLLFVTAHGSTAIDGDHVAVAELLAAAGEPLDPQLLDEADGPLLAWIAARCPPS